MDKYYYRIYGMIVESDVEIEEAFPVEKTHPDIVIEEQSIANEQEIMALARQQEDANVLYRNSREKSEFFYKEFGCFSVEKGTLVNYTKRSRDASEYFSQVLLSKCLPTALVQRGEVLLHGSCVFYHGYAVAVSGESGAGKSSFTDEFIKYGEFMADDTVHVVVENGCGIAHAGYPQRKLCEDTLKHLEVDQDKVVYMPDFDTVKYAVRDTEAYHGTPEKLGAMIVIQKAQTDRVQVEEIQGADKFKYILQNLYLKNAYNGTETTAAIFPKCVAIADKIKVFVVKRPENQMTVKQQVEEIRKRLK